MLLPSRFKTPHSEKSYSNEASYLEDGLSNSPFSITSNVSCRAFLTFKHMFVCLLKQFHEECPPPQAPERPLISLPPVGKLTYKKILAVCFKVM